MGAETSDGRLGGKHKIHFRDILKESITVKKETQVMNASKDSSRLLISDKRKMEGNAEVGVIQSKEH